MERSPIRSRMDKPNARRRLAKSASVRNTAATFPGLIQCTGGRLRFYAKVASVWLTPHRLCNATEEYWVPHKLASMPLSEPGVGPMAGSDSSSGNRVGDHMPSHSFRVLDALRWVPAGFKLTGT